MPPAHKDGPGTESPTDDALRETGSGISLRRSQNHELRADLCRQRSNGHGDGGWEKLSETDELATRLFDNFQLK